MPQALADFEQLPDFRRWQLLNVTHVIDMYPVENDLLTSLEYFEGGVIEDRPRTFTLYRFDAALPHAWMSYEPLVIADDEAALAQLAQPDFDCTTIRSWTRPSARAFWASSSRRPSA
jgi:hypothetical protein